MDPLRLLETTAGFERDLLRSLLAEEAPETARAHVLQAVSDSLGGALSAQMDAPAGASEGAAAASSSSAGSAAMGQVASPIAGGLSAKLALVSKLASLVHVGAMLAGAVVIAGATYLVERGPPEAVPSSAGMERAPTPLVGVVPVESSMRGVEAPQPVPRTSEPSSSDLSSAEPLAPPSTRSAPSKRRSRRARDEGKAGGPRQTAGSLRAQLFILARARDELDEGRHEEALRLLQQYDTRFPEGVLGPEVVLLRQRAHEFRAKRRAQ